jgi:hypothetical protein
MGFATRKITHTWMVVLLAVSVLLLPISAYASAARCDSRPAAHSNVSVQPTSHAKETAPGLKTDHRCCSTLCFTCTAIVPGQMSMAIGYGDEFHAHSAVHGVGLLTPPPLGPPRQSS